MVRNKGLIKGLTMAFAAASLLATASPAAAEPEADARQQTIVVRDGKVLTLDGDSFVLGKRAFLGVGLVDITPQLREHFGAPKETGVLVGSIEEGSPADKAGVRVGDLIVTIDGASIENSVGLRRALRDKKSGDAARIEVLRGRSRHALVASLIEREPAFPKMQMVELEKMQQKLNETIRNPEWKARLEAAGNCGQLQGRIKELEMRLKDLEKKLQK